MSHRHHRFVLCGRQGKEWGINPSRGSGIYTEMPWIPCGHQRMPFPVAIECPTSIEAESLHAVLQPMANYWNVNHKTSALLDQLDKGLRLHQVSATIDSKVWLFLVVVLRKNAGIYIMGSMNKPMIPQPGPEPKAQEVQPETEEATGTAVPSCDDESFAFLDSAIRSLDIPIWSSKPRSTRQPTRSQCFSILFQVYYQLEMRFLLFPPFPSLYPLRHQWPEIQRSSDNNFNSGINASFSTPRYDALLTCGLLVAVPIAVASLWSKLELQQRSNIGDGSFYVFIPPVK
ncbi:hypothetical protein C8J56DRAFT_1053295 [Mycena floridula]|nr:hypothetical protein C8J56DRAFT_1053295 [Mycena floridula]